MRLPLRERLGPLQERDFRLLLSRNIVGVLGPAVWLIAARRTSSAASASRFT